MGWSDIGGGTSVNTTVSRCLEAVAIASVRTERTVLGRGSANMRVRDPHAGSSPIVAWAAD